MTWNGPDPDLRNGPNRSHAAGPNVSLRRGPTCAAKGPNSELRKGAGQGVANGSMYKNANPKNALDKVVPESRLISVNYRV